MYAYFVFGKKGTEECPDPDDNDADGIGNDGMGD